MDRAIAAFIASVLLLYLAIVNTSKPSQQETVSADVNGTAWKLTQEAGNSQTVNICFLSNCSYTKGKHNDN